jgi:hypothetical protein
MDAHQMVWNEKVAKDVINHLEKRRMEGSYSSNASQARDEIVAMIPQGATVFRCGSMTTVDMGLWEELDNLSGVEVINPYQPGLSPEESLELRRKGMTADVMTASSNAVTLDSRSTLMAWVTEWWPCGPKKVILVVGMNKVAPDLESAMARVRNYAGPVNAIRLGLSTPCVTTGLCSDCKLPQRICNMWSIIEGHMIKGRIHVKLVGESLGY